MAPTPTGCECAPQVIWYPCPTPGPHCGNCDVPTTDTLPVTYEGIYLYVPWCAACREAMDAALTECAQ